MMQIKKVSIPEPCHQSWQQMVPANDGRHCENCCKTVVDFTRMSNDEIISYLSINRNVCGRIGEQQVNNINMHLVSRQAQSKGGWAKWIISAALFVSSVYDRANAQSTTHPTEQTVNSNSAAGFPLGKIAFPDSAGYQTISGRVTDQNNEALPGATIKANGGKAGTQTDASGNFTLRVPMSIKQLKISFLGFESTVVEIKKTGKILKVKLKDNSVMLGGLGVTRSSSIRQLYAMLVQRSTNRKLNREI